MIEFRNVSKVYNNGTQALHDINLKVEDGEFVFIVGSSGAGKSTFLKLIMCEERPNSGKIAIDGQDVSRIRKGKIPFVRRKMGIVFQDFRLIDHMTVYDNVAFAMRVVGTSAKSVKKRVPYILGLVGLQHKAKHYPSELSGGEQQRVGLARALVNNPSIIIADEPTGNIDPALSFEIVDLLNEINRLGTTVLMVTHEHSLVKHFHKRIIQIHSGEIIADTGEMEQTSAQEADEEESEDEVLEYDYDDTDTYEDDDAQGHDTEDDSYLQDAQDYDQEDAGIVDNDDYDQDFDYAEEDAGEAVGYDVELQQELPGRTVTPIEIAPHEFLGLERAAEQEVDDE